MRLLDLIDQAIERCKKAEEVNLGLAKENEHLGTVAAEAQALIDNAEMVLEDFLQIKKGKKK